METPLVSCNLNSQSIHHNKYKKVLKTVLKLWNIQKGTKAQPEQSLRRIPAWKLFCLPTAEQKLNSHYKATWSHIVSTELSPLY